MEEGRDFLFLVEVRKPLLADEGYSALHLKIKVIKSSFKGKPCHMTSALWRVIVFHAHMLSLEK